MRFDSNPQTVSWLRDRYLEGQLTLKPPFQRQAVWLAKQKHSLIETVLLNLPVPEVFIQHVMEDDGAGAMRSMFYVVDGQQRIRTLLQFIGVERDARELEWNGFVLEKLPTESPFKDYSYEGLDPEQKRRFLGYRFSVRTLDEASDSDVRDMFRRLNKFLTKLNDQELRNATFTGPFARLASALAERSVWMEFGLVSPAQIRRMKDIEFASELLIGLMHGPQGGSAKTIDEYYAQYDDYEDEFPGEKSIVKRYDETLKVLGHMLPRPKDSRFRANRSDFYSLFVATGILLQDHELERKKYVAVQDVLAKFESNVDKRLANEEAKVAASVARYVRAVQKGANDKARRNERHHVVTELIKGFFKTKKG